MNCKRCGFETNTTTMSKFNLDIICMACKDDEVLAPGYKKADAAELAAVRAGSLNYPGVGLGPVDVQFLRERRVERLQAASEAEVARLRAQGWLPQDFAAALAKELGG